MDAASRISQLGCTYDSIRAASSAAQRTHFGRFLPKHRATSSAVYNSVAMKSSGYRSFDKKRRLQRLIRISRITSLQKNVTSSTKGTICPTMSQVISEITDSFLSKMQGMNRRDCENLLQLPKKLPFFIPQEHSIQDIDVPWPVALYLNKYHRKHISEDRSIMKPTFNAQYLTHFENRVKWRFLSMDFKSQQKADFYFKCLRICHETVPREIQTWISLVRD